MALDLQVKLHPTVLFQIIDYYERRKRENLRVIGTLLGTYEKGVVEVTDCFRVPHDETAQELFIMMDFASEMFELRQQVCHGETIVGWFASGLGITDHSVLIHAFYAKHAKCPQPVHLTIDTEMTSGRMTWKAYVNNVIGVPEGTSGSMFSPVPVHVVPYQAELAAVNLLQLSKYQKNRVFQPASDLCQFADSLRGVENNIDALIVYIDRVLSGEVQPDCAVARKLLSMVNSVPTVSQEQFEEMLNSNIKDVLMVSYLSQLTKTQLKLNEKLTHVKLT